MPLLILALTSLLAAIASASGVATNVPAQSTSPATAEPSRPQDKDDASEPLQTPEQKVATVAYQDYMHSVLQSLRNSPSLRDRALAPQLGFFADISDSQAPTLAERAQRGATLRAAAAAAPDDELVQWLWVQASPEDSGCNASHPCPHRVEALLRLQPDNGSAWVPVFSIAWKAKDIPAAESALSNIARATYFDDQQAAALKAWMDIFHRYPAPNSVFAPGSPESKFDERTTEFWMSFAYGVGTMMPSYQGLVDACRREKHPDASPQRFRDCAQAGRSMMAHSSSLVSRQIGRALLRVSGQATDGDIANARVVDWQYEQWGNLLPGIAENDPDYAKDTADDWIDTGDEIKVLQRELLRKGISLTPPADWQPHGRDGKPISPLGEEPPR